MEYNTLKNTLIYIFNAVLMFIAVLIVEWLYGIELWKAFLLLLASMLFNFGLFNAINQLVTYLKQLQAEKELHRRLQKEQNDSYY